MSRVATTPSYNQVQKASLVILWMVFALSGIVLFEPAPIDALMLGLVWLLPLTGLCALPQRLMPLIVLLMILCSAGLLTATISPRLADGMTHNAITIYLCLSSIVIAGFIYKNPVVHMRWLFSGYTVAALIAATTAMIGYFNIVPGTYELFTEYGRAAGTFKDPNVFGPFLIPVILYCFHQWIVRDAVSGLIPAAIILFLSFAVFLSFSRGAWMHFALSAAIFIYFSYVSAPTNRQRTKILSLILACIMVGAIGLTAALQTSKIRNLLEERASLTQSYDVGPNGRFGGQKKAVNVILDNPMGIGVGVFFREYHPELPHNNYLTAFLRYGWLGGFAYFYLVIATLVLGLRECLRITPQQPFLLVAYASFVGLAAEGLLVDTDHWRHFYVLLGLVWGVMAVRPLNRTTGENSTILSTPAALRQAH